MILTTCIGLIVSKPFGYSETFYDLDINLWKNLGYDVEIFPVNPSNNSEVKSKYYRLPPKPLSQNFFLRILQLLITFLKLFSSKRVPTRIIRFINLERSENVSFKQTIASIYANQHILKSKRLDLIVFGYGNLAITRENIGKVFNAQTIVSFKGADISIFPFYFDYNIYHQLFNRDFFFYFVSEGLRKKAFSHGFPEGKTSYIIPAYIDESLFTGLSPNISNTKRFKLIAVGRLHWKKGHVYLIHAIKILLDQGLEVELQVIGDGEQFEELFWASKTLGVLDMITFQGILPHKEVLDQMKQSGLLIHPSLSEGTPNVVLEAMQFGLPCIVANWLGADEIIVHQWNGWIVEKRNPKKLADQIENFLQLSKAEKDQITANGIATIKNTFNAGRQRAAFQRLLADAQSNT